MLISAPQIVGTEVWRFCSEVGQRKDCRISSQSDASIISVAVTHLKPHRIIYSHVIPERLQTCRKANMSLKDRYIYIYILLSGSDCQLAVLAWGNIVICFLCLTPVHHAGQISLSATGPSGGQINSVIDGTQNTLSSFMNLKQQLWHWQIKCTVQTDRSQTESFWKTFEVMLFTSVKL